MSKRKFPITVKRGNVRVKIYFTPSNGCDAYTLAYYFGGKRVRKTFADLSKAQLEAETVANRICAGELNVLTLTSEDRTAYVRAMEMLKPSGTPLEIAVMQFVETAKLLDGASMLEAAKFYLRHHPRHLPTRTVPQVVEEMIASKEAEGMSALHLYDLKSRLRRFATKFQMPIAMVLGRDMQAYIADLKCAKRVHAGRAYTGRSKNNVRKILKNLFHFAQSRGYLPKGLTEADDLVRVKEAPQPIAIFTPAEMGKLLAHADEDVLPFLAIGAFAGLRHAETLRLDWSEVDLAGGHIEVKANKAKTASRRLVPLSPNLQKWLAPCHRETGKLVAFEKMSGKLKKLTEKESVGFKWKRNALRHSFISYRVAQTQNVAQTALEAGNSPQIIFSNYRELVKPADAVKWFAIEPETPANIIPSPVSAAIA
jgi:integrase